MGTLMLVLPIEHLLMHVKQKLIPSNAKCRSILLKTPGTVVRQANRARNAENTRRTISIQRFSKCHDARFAGTQMLITAFARAVFGGRIPSLGNNQDFIVAFDEMLMG